MTQDIITAILGSSALSGLGAWFFTKRKSDAEARTVELKNTSTEVGFWRDIADELKAEVSSRNDELTGLKNQMSEIIGQNKELIEQNKQLLGKIANLKSIVDKQSKEIHELKQSIK